METITRLQHTPAAESAATRTTVMAVALLGMFMTVLDCVIITIALPTITAAFHAEIAVSQWTMTGYLTAMTASMLVFARLAADFGKNRIFLAGMAVFTIASLGCAVAPTLQVLIAMRVLQGVGAAMAIALVMAIVFELYPFEMQGKAMGLLGGTVAVASLSGPCLGGVLLDLAGWQAIFLINIPVGILLLVLGIRSMDLKRPDASDQVAMDRGGAASLVVAVASFMVLPGLLAGEGMGRVWAAAVAGIGLAALVIFVRTERRHPYPLLDPGIFRKKVFVVPLFSMVAFFCALLIMEVSLPFYLQGALGFSALQVGGVFMLIAGILTVGSPLVGKLYDRVRWNHYTTAGLAVSAVGLVAFASFAGSKSLAPLLGALVVFTLGFTLFQSPVNTEIMRGLPMHQASLASGLNSTGRHFGMTVGASAAALIFAVHLRAAGYAGEIAGADAAQITGATTTAMLAAAVICGAAIALKVPGWGRDDDDSTPGGR